MTLGRMVAEKKGCFFWLPIIFWLALTAWAFADELKTGLQYNANTYHVGPGDVLSVSVYHQPEFSQGDVLVRADGNASINGVGDIPVAGKTVEELDQLISQRLSDLVLKPLVTVTISQPRAATVYLSGAVKNPGMFQVPTSIPKTVVQSQPTVRPDFRLSNVLANAGGVLANADLHHIHVKDPNGQPIADADLWKVLKAGDLSQDLWLQSGDAVEVPALDHIDLSDADYQLLIRSAIGPGTFPVRVMGEVNTPGVYDLSGLSPNLQSAIAKAGGYKYGANKQMIAVRRFTSEHSAQTVFIKTDQQDDTLRPNDIVYVSETRLYRQGRYFEQVAKIFSPFTSFATTLFGMSYLLK